jgi:hypothetical protein
MDALDTGVRGGPDLDSMTLEAYGLEIPEALAARFEERTTGLEPATLSLGS